MNSMSSQPLRLPAVKVEQPLGEFYAVAISARFLRQVVFLDPTASSRWIKIPSYTSSSAIEGGIVAARQENRGIHQYR